MIQWKDEIEQNRKTKMTNQEPIKSPQIQAPGEVWAQHWGKEYNAAGKDRIFHGVFTKLRSDGRLGKVIADIGSGASPVTRNLPKMFGSRVIAVDVATQPQGFINALRVKLDIETLNKPTQETREALAKVATILGIKTPCDPEDLELQRQIDTIVCSDILNYVDYRNVVISLKKYLKKGGRMVIFEIPGRGYPEHFSPQGLDSLDNLKAHLKKEGFILEEGDYGDAVPNNLIVACYEG